MVICTVKPSAVAVVLPNVNAKLVFKSTLTLLELRFETTRSGLASVLKSADATVLGFEPTAKITGDLKEPSPLPFSNAIVLA